jgi:hypothetical protein
VEAMMAPGKEQVPIEAGMQTSTPRFNKETT